MKYFVHTFLSGTPLLMQHSWPVVERGNPTKIHGTTPWIFDSLACIHVHTEKTKQDLRECDRHSRPTVLQ